MSAILWKRLDVPGHDACRLVRLAGGWRLSGAAAFGEEARPNCLTYEVDCDAAFATRSARVTGFVGRDPFAVEIVKDGVRWLLNGAEQPEVAGCIDVDLNFTPATNLLAIRRFNLADGQATPAAAAWLLFPEQRLARLEQTYARVDEARYAYSGYGYADTLEVSPSGFVTRYPGLWDTDFLQEDPHG